MRETHRYEDAAASICAASPDGELHIVSPMFPAQPDKLLGAVIDAASQRGIHVRLYAADLSGRYRFLPDPPKHAQLVTIGGRVPARLSVHVDYIPATLYEIARAFADGLIRVDAFVAQVGPPDAEGRCSFGPVVSYSPSAMAAASHVALEINEAIPVLAGTPGPVIDDADVVLRAGVSEIPGLGPVVPGPEHRRIGALLSELIPSGATLQFGVGGIPQTFLPMLRQHRNLHIHSGALPESVMELFASGAVADEPRITTSLLGTGRLYEWAADPANQVLVLPVTETHAPAALAKLDAFYTVNSAFEVDITGQVNAEMFDGIKRSSAGGQADLGRWAHHISRGNIIALRARRPDGRAAIVERLSAPYAVTMHRSDVDFVVTEHGIADLRGRSFAQRIDALRRISG